MEKKAFIAIYSMLKVVDYSEHDTCDEAKRSLILGSKEGNHFPIAIVETKTRQTVWHNTLLIKSDCQRVVNKFIILKYLLK